MSDAIIRARGLGKLYRLGAGGASGDRLYRYGSLRESLASRLGGFFRRGAKDPRGASGGSLWALSDVSFDVNPLTPCEEEQKRNPRPRSAKLRGRERI